jgi:hypothetical protein
MSCDVIESNGFAYPTPLALQEATCGLFNQELEFRDDLLLKLFPEERVDANVIAFKYQNIFCGTQSWRGLGNTLPVVDLSYAEKYCQVEPGYWGEMANLDERDLTKTATYGPNGCAKFIDLTEAVAFKNRWLFYREMNLQRKLIAEALMFGLYETLHPETGAVVQRQKYNIHEETASVGWSDYANAQPFVDINNLKYKYEQLTPFRFDCNCGARTIMNPRTFQKIVRNTNTANWQFLFGRNCLNCTTTQLNTINEQLCAMGLPNIELYNGSYQECTGSPQFAGVNTGNYSKRYLIPDDMFVMLGCTNSEVIGKRVYTRNAIGCGDVTSGPFAQVVDNCQVYPRKLQVMRAWNGGIALPCPNAIVSVLVK